MRIVSEKWEISRNADLEKVAGHSSIYIEIRRRVKVY
jgi:hypothetical protein